jgi:hypothetical protein
VRADGNFLTNKFLLALIGIGCGLAASAALTRA